MKKKIICIAGRTSAGKSYIADMLAKVGGLKIVKSYTTRPPREEEIKKGLENTDHIFISEEEYDRLTDIAAETSINGYRYCTTAEVIEQADIYVIDPLGIKSLKENMKDRFDIVEVYVSADREIRKKRYVERDNPTSQEERRKKTQEFEARDAAEDEQFAEYEKEKRYHILIRNIGNSEFSPFQAECFLEEIMR